MRHILSTHFRPFSSPCKRLKWPLWEKSPTHPCVVHLKVNWPCEIWTSATNRSFRGNLAGLAARSAIPLMMSSHIDATSSGRSRPRMKSEWRVRMMFSNSSSAQGAGASRITFTQSSTVVSPKRAGSRQESNNVSYHTVQFSHWQTGVTVLRMQEIKCHCDSLKYT